jgi:hypothetical protein
VLVLRKSKASSCFWIENVLIKINSSFYRGA